MQKKWAICKNHAVLQKDLASSLNISPITAQILLNRQIQDANEAEIFLKPELSRLHDPYLLKDMDKAVDRIKTAISKKEKILIYGDYDVDGLTAVALLICAFKKLGVHVSHFIPNRLEEGYGFNEKIVQIAKDKEISLIITVDCGISAADVVSALTNSKIDVIVTDHHEPVEGKFPDAFAVINPLQEGCAYPFKHLSGVGVAFKLAQAIFDSSTDLEEFLDLVALGTIADVVPLLGENRILVKHGLSVLSNTRRKGIKALIEAASIRNKEISARNVSHILGPRINAQGRLGSPESALRLLLTDHTDEAKDLAVLLDSDNRKRREIEQKTLKEALAKVEQEINFKEHRVIVLSDENWHKGVIGIVASRIVEQYYRPAILISVQKDTGKGSGRSIKGFDLISALAECREYLEDFGGHEAACGLAILKDNIENFKNAINKLAHKKLSPIDLLPTIDIDAELHLEELDGKFLEELESLAPFGRGNPQPVFLSRDVELKTKPAYYGRDGSRFWVKKGKVTCEAVSYNKIEIADKKILDMVYAPSVSKYHGLETIKLQLKDFR